jgi:hypothetical protein
VAVILVPVEVVDHVFPEAALDVNITDPPVQKVVVLPAEIFGVAGNGLTVTVVAEDIAIQPFPSVSVTV